MTVTHILFTLRTNSMTHATRTIVDRPYWVVIIPKPSVPSLRDIGRAVRRWGLVSLLAGYSLAMTAGVAHGAEPAPIDECQASAELHYAISGGDDAAYEDAYHACTVGVPYPVWAAAGDCEVTGWAERDGAGWRAVCGDVDGNEVSR